MTVVTTAWFDLVEGLLAKFRADATIATTYGTDVRDGPLKSNEVQDRPNFLFVGTQPSDTEAGDAAGTVNQTWGELGARAKYEDLTVPCELVCQAGDTSLTQRRTDAKAILAAVESALRTDFTLSVAQLLWCHMSAGTPQQKQTPNGSALVIPFTITGRARLASQ
jgi:hypothetical protein